MMAWMIRMAEAMHFFRAMLTLSCGTLFSNQCALCYYLLRDSAMFLGAYTFTLILRALGGFPQPQIVRASYIYNYYITS